MHESENNDNSTSIENDLFHTSVQSTVSTDSIDTNSVTEQSSSISISFPKHSHLNKQKIVSDTTPQSITHSTSYHSEQKMATPITSSASTVSRSKSCSSTKHNKS